MLILIQWVLALAPIGVFALALVVGAKAGAEAFGALVHYVLIVSSVGAVIWLASFVLSYIGGRRGPITFFRAAMPAMAVAISTQSSLASLPAMVGGVRAMGVGERTSDVVLPIAVALFRATGPCMNLAVSIYVAHLMGIELSITALAIGVAAAAITTMGAVSLPGSVSFITSVAPINIAMGIPVEPLVLLLAIEAFPDIMRTLGNVTMDMAVTTTIATFENDSTTPATAAGESE
jgi:Na+/H+-dicarboxylate symporter